MTAENPPARPEPSPAAQIAWAVVATALLAAWIGWRMGWVWAFAGVFGIFVHEYGHLLVINALGSGPSRIRIIPFFGGAATMPTPPSTEFKGVLMALAGPLFGLLATAPFFVATAVTGDRRWIGGAFFIAVINLINLAPAPPLDGSKVLGPALARIHPLLEKAALLVVGALAVVWGLRTGNTLFGLFVGVATLGSLRNGVARPSSERLSVTQALASAGLWLIALALCFIVAIAAGGHG